MIIDPRWRILTIGDGDLSFSHALLDYCDAKQIVATVFDSPDHIERKYGLAHYRQLKKASVQVETNVDITNPVTFTQLNRSFDIVIFQFPLIPNFQSAAAFSSRLHGADINTLHRWLLHQFLVNSERYFLDEAGQKLCCITSKDVKPYCDWDLESSIVQNTAFSFIGQTAFDVTKFAGYRVRNVDRPGEVKDTCSVSYYYSLNEFGPLRQQLLPSDKLRPDFCRLCGAGPFTGKTDRDEHESGKRHSRAVRYASMWRDFLNKIYDA